MNFRFKIVVAFVGPLATLTFSQTQLSLSRTPGAEVGPGIPACSEAPGWYSLFDGTSASVEKYWFNPSGQYHGDNSRWWVTGGILYSDQSADRKGGCIYTKKQYKNVEVKSFVKPYWGNDAGYFLRANTVGRAYQAVLDYVPGGTKAIGGVWGENRPSGQDINYKPFGFTSPTQINVRSEWFLDGTAGKEKLTAADWTTKIWKSTDYNWVAAKIYNDDIPIIDTWINGYQMIHYLDPANKASNETQVGHITMQVHTGSTNWSINNPNLYKNILVREVKANGEPLAVYPEWSAACASGIRTENQTVPLLHWKYQSADRVELNGSAPEPFTLSLRDSRGKTIFETIGKQGSFSYSAPISSGNVNILTIRTSQYVETYQLFQPRL